MSPVPSWADSVVESAPSVTPFRSRAPRRASLLALFAGLALSPPLAAQDDDPDLRAELERTLKALAALNARVAQLEAEREQVAEDDLEAQLQALLGDEPQPVAAPRTVFPSAFNPRVAVYLTSLAEAGNAEERLGLEGDRFSLREVELDMRLPVSPFAEGVLVAAWEDATEGEFESRIEEGYADVSLGALFDAETAAKLRLGRFRLHFGRVNVLHTHDLPQVDRPWGSIATVGAEGLIGDGVELTLPVWSTGEVPGDGRAVVAQVALVNGELFTGDEGPLGELADGAGLALDSDAPMVVARLSHHAELDTVSDLELGASVVHGVGGRAVRTDLRTDVDHSLYALDATWRQRDDESGQDSWLVMAEAIRADTRFEPTGAAGFPVGDQRADGWWLTTQRQLGQNTYLGLRVGQGEVLGSDGTESFDETTPYVSWYPDEFFRVRLQGQHLEYDSTARDSSVNRALLEVTWNFGSHTPHPFWTNR